MGGRWEEVRKRGMVVEVGRKGEKASEVLPVGGVRDHTREEPFVEDGDVALLPRGVDEVNTLEIKEVDAAVAAAMGVGILLGGVVGAVGVVGGYM